MVLRIEGEKIGGGISNARLNNGDYITGFLTYLSHDENDKPCILEVDLSDYFSNRPVKQEGEYSITLTNSYKNAGGKDIVTKDVFKFRDGKLYAFEVDPESKVFGARVIEDQLMIGRKYSELEEGKQNGADEKHKKELAKHKEREKKVINSLKSEQFDIEGEITENLKKAVDVAHEGNGLKHIGDRNNKKARKRSADTDPEATVKAWDKVMNADTQKKADELRTDTQEQSSDTRQKDTTELKDNSDGVTRRTNDETRRGVNLYKKHKVDKSTEMHEVDELTKNLRLSDGDIDKKGQANQPVERKRSSRHSASTTIHNHNTTTNNNIYSSAGNSLDRFRCEVYDRQTHGDNAISTQTATQGPNGIICFDLGKIYNDLNHDNSLDNKPIEKVIHGVDEMGLPFEDKFTYFNGKLVSFELASNSTNLSVVSNLMQVEQHMNDTSIPTEHRMSQEQIQAEKAKFSGRTPENKRLYTTYSTDPHKFQVRDEGHQH